MNIAVITRLPSGRVEVHVSDQHDRHMLALMQELAVEPDAARTVWVTAPTGGTFVIDGDSILEAFEVPEGTDARGVRADYLQSSRMWWDES